MFFRLFLSKKDEKTPIKKDNETENNSIESETKTIIIHKKELHLCQRCRKDIPEDELEMEDICTRHASRGRSATYKSLLS